MCDLQKRITEDGSITFFNTKVKECYHAPVGAHEESLQKYIIPSEFALRCKTSVVTVLDVCFGMGYNSLLAIDTVKECGGKLSITALEIDKNIVYQSSICMDKPEWRKCLAALYEKAIFIAGNSKIEMMWGDARESCRQLIASGKKYNLIYHDPFSTQRNAELWTVDFFAGLYDLLMDDGLVLTYSTSIPVIAGFIETGFFVGRTEVKGTQRCGLAAAKKYEVLSNPYSSDEIKQLLRQPKAIPYYDKHHTGTNRDILRERNMRIT